MTITDERVKAVKYYVVGGQAFEGSLNDGEVKRLTDCDLLLANAANLYKIVDTTGFVMVDLLSFLTSDPIFECVPQAIIDRLMKTIDLTVMALAVVVQRVDDVPAIMNDINAILLSEVKEDNAPTVLSPTQLVYASQHRYLELTEDGHDMTNVVTFTHRSKIGSSAPISPQSA